jgi:ankyrin repeat protein
MVAAQPTSTRVQRITHRALGVALCALAILAAMYLAVAGLRAVGLLPAQRIVNIGPPKDVASANVPGAADFFAAIQSGKLDDVRQRALANPQLLRAGDAMLATGLHRAVEKGDLPMVRLLLDLQAPIDLRDSRYEMTPLAWAVSWGRPEIVQALLNRGARVEPAMFETAQRGIGGGNTWSKQPAAAYEKVLALLKQHTSAEARPYPPRDS